MERSLDTRTVIATWWPLAASWLMMALELPLVSMAMARLPSPTESLAAYGGVVFPISLVVEGPIIMLLSASTALARDRQSYSLIRGVMIVSALVLTAIHMLVAFTPLFDLIATDLLKVPSAIVEQARLGLRIMTPWAGTIAYRRFMQGVMIRTGHSGLVGIGTVVRIAVIGVALMIGMQIDGIPGIQVGATAVALAVTAEAIFSGIAVRPLLKRYIYTTPNSPEPLTYSAFSSFYTPLALTPLVNLLSLPVATAAVSRMPLPIESLAAWPVVNGLVFGLRSMGFAFNEVVVALADRPRALPTMRRFAWQLGIFMTVALALMAATPASQFWFLKISALAPEVAAVGMTGLWISLMLPALAVHQSWYQGILVAGRETRAVTEAVLIYIVIFGAVLWFGVANQSWVGLWVGLAGSSVGGMVQNLWMGARARAFIVSTEQSYADTMEEPPVDSQILPKQG